MKLGKAASAAWLLALAAILLASCTQPPPPPSPAQVRAQILRLLPPGTLDRRGWATDIQAAFAAQEIEPSTQNLCATLAVTEQESGFRADPAVPGLPRIARAEIDRRAKEHNVPAFVMHAALKLASHDGVSYDERLSKVRTEQDLSRLYEDLIGAVPMGKRLLRNSNPVHTGGPMQVSVAFAEEHARDFPYPYAVEGSIRHEVFTRRGGMYFGIAHLLGYPAHYPQPLYRFADYNAGFYASRNAAFQHAVSLASGVTMPLDGDLVRYAAAHDGSTVGATEAAVRVLAPALDLTQAQIHRALLKGERAGFEDTRLYQRVFEVAEDLQHRPSPRVMLPRITLNSPKITRQLTTEWFARRVNQRYQRCMARASARHP